MSQTLYNTLNIKLFKKNMNTIHIYELSYLTVTNSLLYKHMQLFFYVLKTTFINILKYIFIFLQN